MNATIKCSIGHFIVAALQRPVAERLRVPAKALLFTAFLLASCDGPHNGHNKHEQEIAGREDAPLYQCPMHPQVSDIKPSSCPICGMDLAPVKKMEAAGIEGRAPVELNETQRRLINIRTSYVKHEPVELTLDAAGVIEHDQASVFSVSAWTSGRIEELYIDEEEAVVQEGAPLYSIYSPRLYTALQELAQLRKGRDRNRDLIKSAERRLEQMGLPRHSHILKNIGITEIAPVIDVPAPVGGVVMEKKVREGDYVSEGDLLYVIVDLSRLWLMVDVYESELPFVSVGDEVIATTPALPGQEFHGRVEKIYHEIERGTRTARLRVEIGGLEPDPPAAARLVPGIWMQARIIKTLGERLVVPRSAVFDTGKRSYVYVREGEGLFIPREVETGPVVNGRYVIEEGLNEGEEIVIEGTFLLDSESQLRAAGGAPEHQH